MNLSLAMELTTARTTLRPLGSHDVPAMHALWTDAGVRKYLWDDIIIPLEHAAEVVAASIVSFEQHRFGMWAVTDNASGELAGFCGLRLSEEGVPELLYGFYPRYWGKGYATETAKAVLAHAFLTLGCSEVVAATDVPNEASVRVLERLMRFERRGTLNGLDTFFYRLSREQFR
jgi:ribosomal-protein-alanine N-acetyltransferase